MKRHSPREIAFKVLPPDVQRAFAQAGTTAYPFAQGDGLWIERLGHDYLISHLPGTKLEPALHQLTRLLPPATSHQSRFWLRKLVAQALAQQAPCLHRLSGDPSTMKRGEAEELGRRYGLDFGAYTVGLFLDQAQNREKVATLCQAGQRLLNLFAYTCSFSVVAATCGAETISVDLSKPALARGKENFARNEVDLAPSADAQPRHRFLADDTFAVLPRLAKREERFDWIILDPPTFSRGKRGSKKKVFRVERDLPELIQLCWPLLHPGGRFLVSSNCTALGHQALQHMIHATLQPFTPGGSYVLQPAPTIGHISAPGPATACWLERV